MRGVFSLMVERMRARPVSPNATRASTIDGYVQGRRTSACKMWCLAWPYKRKMVVQNNSPAAHCHVFGIETKITTIDNTDVSSTDKSLLHGAV